MAVFLWIFAGNSVSNWEVFWLLLSGAYTDSRPSLPLTIPPASGLRAPKKLGGDTAKTADPHWPKGHSLLAYKAQHVKLREEEWRGGLSEWWCLSVCLPKSMLCMPEPCLPGDCWTPGCPREVVNEFLICFGCVWSLCFNPQPSQPTSSLTFPVFPPHQTGVREWLCGS